MRYFVFNKMYLKRSIVLFFLMFFTTLPLFSMENTDDTLELEHINSAKKLLALKSQYPILQERNWNFTSDPRYVSLPKDDDFSDNVERLLKEYPIQGTWIVLKKQQVVGHIELYNVYPSIHIHLWFYPEYRHSGIGTQAHIMIFNNIRPFLDKKVTCIKIDRKPRFTPEQEALSRKEKYELRQSGAVPIDRNEIESSFIFNGITSDISPDNYASIISELRVGSRIIGYDGTEKVSNIHFHYPVKEISKDEIGKDSLLKILKQEVEPFIVNKDTRDKSIKRLKEISEEYL